MQWWMEQRLKLLWSRLTLRPYQTAPFVYAAAGPMQAVAVEEVTIKAQF